jgi:hypothetical protein
MSSFDPDALVEPADERRFIDASLLPALEWPQWSEADEVALTATLIAGDPARRDEPAAGEVVADAEVAPLSPALIARLARVDVAGLDDSGLVSFTVAWTRVANHASAQVARAVSRFHARVDRAELLGPSSLTSAEFAVALGLGSGAADRLVANATALAARLPDTLAALDRGELSWRKASVLAERTAVLTPEQARQVETLVLPAAAARTPARHAEAVRRAVDRIDPSGMTERRQRAERDIALIRTHVGDGMGELFARMPSEDLDTVWTGADAWARRAKAAGDPRTLDQLRIAALVRWATSFWRHGDSSACDRQCDPLAGARSDPLSGEIDDACDEPSAGPPTRHGRPIAVRVLWDLRSLLGLADKSGELADSGAVLTSETLRAMLANSVVLRRLLVDPTTGELVDLSVRADAPAPSEDHAHRSPFELQVVVTLDEWEALQTGSDPGLCAAVEAAPCGIRDMLIAPITAATVDATPDAYPAPVALADFVATRDRHPSNPCAGLSSAHASDLDHVVPVRDGGDTVRDNLTTPTRRWHRLRTLGGWTVRRVGRGWLWTSPLGRTAMTSPYDYRL